jgi:hypothetical protein
MKTFPVVVVFFLLAQTVFGQVIFRNDFVFNRKQRRLENRGLTFITINLDNRPNLNQLLNGRGGRTLAIDVRAIRHPRKVYSYQEIAEKVYLPAPVGQILPTRVPLFLLVGPPVKARIHPVTLLSPD